MRLLHHLVLPPLCATILLSGAANALTGQAVLVKERAFLIEPASQTVLLNQEADTIADPASLTKLMTAYVVLDAVQQKRLALTQTVPVPREVMQVEGSRMFLEAGEQVSIETLLRGMLTVSANDAALLLASATAGNVGLFVAQMNAQAQALGMHHSAFKNPHGLSEAGHHSTARDLATLAIRLWEDFPKAQAYFAEPRYTHRAISQNNRHPLLGKDGVDGLKTGHTEAAGYCLVSTATRAGRRLFAVHLGAKNEKRRAQASKELLDYGFNAFALHTLVVPPQPFLVANGAPQYSEAIAPQNPWLITLPRHSPEPKLLPVLSVISAPVQARQVIGQVHLQLGEHLLAQQNLLSKEAVHPISAPLQWWRTLKIKLIKNG
ncbi:MAG: hypothetical protein RLZZ502_1843 [Pseudomonadota bacterium]|jgi:D-alanyl-D-alanine carboxypeptidase (penicillin-binding protein 5/6)